MFSTLPPNATEFELRIEKVINSRFDAILENVDEIKKLWNWNECRADFLPYLAYALKVTIWNEGWSEQTKRDFIGSSWETRPLLGTRSAVPHILQALGVNADVKYWYEKTPKGTPGTFSVEASINDNITNEGLIIQPERTAEMERVIDDVKRGTQHYDLTVTSTHRTNMKAALTGSASVRVDGKGSAVVVHRVTSSIRHAAIVQAATSVNFQGTISWRK